MKMNSSKARRKSPIKLQSELCSEESDSTDDTDSEEQFSGSEDESQESVRASRRRSNQEFGKIYGPVIIPECNNINIDSEESYAYETSRTNEQPFRFIRNRTSRSHKPMKPSGRPSCRNYAETNRQMLIPESNKSNIYSRRSSAEKTTKTNERKKYLIVIGVILVLAFGFFSFMNNDNVKKEDITIESIKQNFPNQEEIFWKSIVSGINDTVNLARPSSFIFLFENEAENITKELLHKISEYAVCKLTVCESSALNFTEILESNTTTNDYGSIIANVREKLQTNGLMVIENLDQVPGEYAMVFHNFCDEFAPVVDRSAFFFTMKIDKFENSSLFDLRTVEKTLRRKWHNIEEDKFSPLFTRISSMLLRIHPTKKTKE